MDWIIEPRKVKCKICGKKGYHGLPKEKYNHIPQPFILLIPNIDDEKLVHICRECCMKILSKISHENYSLNKYYRRNKNDG